MYLLIKMGIFHCYVSLPEGNNAIILVNFSSTEPTSFAKKMSSTESSTVQPLQGQESSDRESARSVILEAFGWLGGRCFLVSTVLGALILKAVDIFVGVLCEW